jgi:hypothetical protein
MIQSLVYQRPTSLLQQYEFVLTWETEGESQIFLAVVTVSHRDGVTTIVDISVEGDLPTGFADAWDPEWAVKQIHFELAEELDRLNRSETF